MYNDLKKHWTDQFRLSTNKVFADFLYYLERGGENTTAFIKSNSDLVETVAGGPDEVEAIVEFIASDTEAAENKAYFFSTAKKMLLQVRALIQRKYDASVRYCEDAGIPVGDFTAETLLPGVRKAEENDGFIAPETTPTGIDPDSDPEQEAPGADTAPEQEAPETHEAEAEMATSDADVNLKEVDGDQAPAETLTETMPITEDDLKAKINVLVGDGSSKQEVWQAVSNEAKLIGWTSRQVWAYVDEITTK